MRLRRSHCNLELALRCASPLAMEVCLIDSSLFFLNLSVFDFSLFVCVSGESSTDTLSGWAETLPALYNEIGGCIGFFSCLPVLPYFFLYFVFLLDRARHHFKKVDFYKLLRYNLEHNCVVSA